VSLFPDLVPDRPAFAAGLGPRLATLAERGVFLGTSSWKYEGWLGSLYDPSLYQTRGKLSMKKFETECLGEYARVFPVVGGDFSFYQFPSAEYWKKLFDGSPDTLRFGLKVRSGVHFQR